MTDNAYTRRFLKDPPEQEAEEKIEPYVDANVFVQEPVDKPVEEKEET